jgi:geranylgeranyl diphosphate synthase type II
MPTDFDGMAYLAEVRALVVERIQGFVPKRTRYQRELYDLVLEYPLRAAKGLRPALAVATCRALGGQLEAVLPTAAVLELYHNAFLVHDDVEDGSEQRRGQQTLQSEHGVPIAVNVGDAMLALTLKPLLGNTRLIGLGNALKVLDAISEMAMHSVEGQALELFWVRTNNTTVTCEQYLEMVQKKTAHYTFVAPIRCGAMIAGANEEQLAMLGEFALLLGVAFQIQDDLLNLTHGAHGYGKERYGDLWEGKYTLVLIETLARASTLEREEIQRILSKRRPLVPDFETEGVKTTRDVERLVELIERHGAIERTRQVAQSHAERAAARFERLAAFIPESVHRSMLHWLVDYSVERGR